MDFALEKELGLTPQLNMIFNSIPDECVLSPEDIADLLQRSKETVRRWCRTGKLPAYNFGGKYTILGNDFKQFMLNSHTRTSRNKKLLQ